MAPYNSALEALEQGVNGGQEVGALQALGATVAAANATTIRSVLGLGAYDENDYS